MYESMDETEDAEEKFRMNCLWKVVEGAVYLKQSFKMWALLGQYLVF